MKNESFSLHVKTNHNEFKEDALMFICDLTSSVGSFTKINEDADVSAGFLHRFIIKSEGVIETTVQIMNLLLGNKEKDDKNITFNASEIYVQTERELGLNVDGDQLTTTPAKIKIRPNHLYFYC